MALRFVQRVFDVFYYRFLSRNAKIDFHKGAVFITGCDSGLGYSFAVHLKSKGVQVFAGVYNESSPGAKSLKDLRISVLKMDITNSNSVQGASVKIKEALMNNKYEYFGLVNNAGVMVVGEFEWLTEEMMSQQVSVNLIGPMRVIKYFMPILRQKRGRIVNISSHCAGFPLPGMSIYSASKCGLRSLSQGLNRELQKFGIKVVELVPGSFILHSCIMSKQKEYSDTMSTEMSDEVKKFYQEYFNRYTAYLSTLPVPDLILPPKVINDPVLFRKLESAIFSSSPRSIYINEPPRYFFYYTLFSLLPDCHLKEYLVRKFIKMPEWEESCK